MPYDQKRVNGPDISIPYRVNSKINLKTHEEKLQEAFTTAGLRQDGRKFGESRKIFIKCGVVSQAKGSAYIEMGRTKVIVSVFDPREIPKQNQYSLNGELFCDLKFSSFACTKRRLPQPDADEKSLSLTLKKTLQSAVCLHEFSNFQVDVYVNVLEDDGSVLGAAVTCAGLALADAGIPMYDLITASTIGVIGDKILLDPTSAEEDICNVDINGNEHGLVMIAQLSTHEQISELWQSGFLKYKTVRKVNNILMKSNTEIVPIIKQILLKKIVKNIEETKDNN